jgi:hypothetical protein
MERPGPKPADEDADGVTEAEILEWVRSCVWSGRYEPEEVGWSIEDQLFEGDEVDGDWLRQVIVREFAAKREAEKAWPRVTDCDRLDRAFETLRRRGGIALHVAGYTQADGLAEVEDAYLEAGGEDSGYAGHCFYTEQDQEGALDGGGLYIGFGHLSGDDAKGVEFGQMVRAALEGEGLVVEWDGTIRTRLYVNGFRWQRRSPL